MCFWLALWACGGATPEPLRSLPAPPTRDLSTSALVIPSDSALFPFIPAGVPAWPTGTLGRLSPGLPVEQMRAVSLEIREPYRPPPEMTPGPGMVAVSGHLKGFEHVGFVAFARDGALAALDVSARPGDWDGLLETQWGPGEPGAFANGMPTTTWRNPAIGLVVTQVRGTAGLVVVNWAVSSAGEPPAGVQ